MWIVIAFAFATSIDVLFRASGGDLSHPAPDVYLSDPGHGRPVERITLEQYNHFRSNEIRGASGIMLIFYLQFAFAFLRPPPGTDGPTNPGSGPRGSVRGVVFVWKGFRQF